MEFDKILTEVEGRLLSLGRQGLLNKSDPSESVEALKELLVEDRKSRARVAFFFLLNTKLDVSNRLKDDCNIGLLVDVCPNLEKNFLIDLLFELHLEAHINDIIINCPSALSLEILEVLVRKLKTPGFHKKVFSKHYIENILKAIFMKLTLPDDGNSKTLYLLFEEVAILFYSMISTSVQIPSEEFMEHTSHLFYNYFELLLYCLKLMENPRPNHVVNDVFQIVIDLSVKDTENIMENPTQKSINLLLSYCENAIKLLTLDLWITWSEFMFDLERSVQRAVGETIFGICEAIEKQSIFVSDEMMACFTHLKMKPLTEADKIDAADIDEIMRNVKEKSSKKWFKALLRSPHVCENEEAVTCILNNMKLADVDDLLELCKAAECHIINIKQQCSTVKVLFLSAFRTLPKDMKIKFMSSVIENQEFIDHFQRDSMFMLELTEKFNKMKISEFKDEEQNAVCLELLCLCVQSPYKTVFKLCQHAVKNASENSSCCKVLSLLRPACAVIEFTNDDGQLINGFNLLTFVLSQIMKDDELTPKEYSNLIHVISFSQKNKLLDKQFLEKCVFDAIVIYLEKENWKRIGFFLDVLQAYVKPKVFECNKVIALAFMVRVLDCLSWDWTCFSIQKSEAREVVLVVVSVLIKILAEDGPEVSWLRRETSKAWEVNRIILCGLWLNFGRKFQNSEELYVQLLMLVSTTNKRQALQDSLSLKLAAKKSFEMRSSVIVALIKVLPVLTTNQWKCLFYRLIPVLCPESPEPETNNESDCELQVLDYFATALYVLCLDKNEQHFHCLHFCVRNFGHLMQKIITPRPLKASAVREMLKNIVMFLKVIEFPQHRKSCCMTLCPVILDLIDKMSQEIHEDEIMRWTSLLGCGQVETAVKNRLRDRKGKN